MLHEVSFIPVKRHAGLLQLESISRRVCTLFLGDTLLKSMGMLGDKQGDSYSDKHSSSIICEAFGSKKAHYKLLWDTLVTNMHLYAHSKIYFDS